MSKQDTPSGFSAACRNVACLAWRNLTREQLAFFLIFFFFLLHQSSLSFFFFSSNETSSHLIRTYSPLLRYACTQFCQVIMQFSQGFHQKYALKINFQMCIFYSNIISLGLQQIFTDIFYNSSL